MSRNPVIVKCLPYGSELDASTIARARTIFLDAFKRAYGPLVGSTPGMPATDNELQRFLDDAFVCDAKDLAKSVGNTVAYVATKEGMVVGYLSVDKEADNKRVYLRQLAVCPKTQRSGVGRKLVQQAMEDNKQACEVRVSLRKANSSAQKFYSNLGFEDDNNCHGTLDGRLYRGMVLRREV